jgi:hypothetical protein
VIVMNSAPKTRPPSMWIGFPARLVAVLIGMTAFWVTAQRVFPSGVMAISSAGMPTRIAGPGVLVAVLIGVTAPRPPT